MRNLCENMLLISRYNWLNILQASDLISSKKLKLLTTVFLKNNFCYLLDENSEENENENENEDKNTNIIEIKNENNSFNINANFELSSSFLEIVRDNYPDFLENVLLERKNIHPSPPSHLIMKYTKINAREKKFTEEASSRNVPIWAILMAGFSYLIFQNISNLKVLGIFMPILNCIFFVFLLLYTFGFCTKPDKMFF